VRDIRVLIAELQRINSHLVWLGTHGMEVGAVSVMLYCFRERELLLNINEMLAGFRLFPSYMRVGGLREDCRRGFSTRPCESFLDRFIPKLETSTKTWLTKTDLPEATQKCRVFEKDAVRFSSSGRSRARRVSTTTSASTSPTLATRPTSSRCRPDQGRRLRALSGARRGDAGKRELCRQALDRIPPTGAFAVDDPRITPPPKIASTPRWRR
jgi:NADH-quinone oxidoreductase subunit D